ncbi:MAG: hypothetical protein KUG72_11635 [Pseudomonadales bacterium]|nr:hypothetical protein [Pseudomonadales bacterium]
MYTTVKLPVGASRTLFGWLCFIHFVVLLSVVFLSLSTVVRFFLVMLVLLSLAHTLRQHYFRTAVNSVRAVVLRSDRSSVEPVEMIPGESSETWQLVLHADQPAADGERPLHTATLTSSYLVTPWLVLLNFKIEGRLRALPVLLFPDATDAEQLRRLRILLLH